MFFFIAGVHPRVRPVDGGGRRTGSCARCGGDRVFEEVRVRPYFSLFFVPLLPVGSGSPAWRCVSCGTLREGGPARFGEVPETVPTWMSEARGGGLHCALCGARISGARPSLPRRVQCPSCGEEFEIRP